MSDNATENGAGVEESFADLFESYEAGMSDRLKVGDKIRGTVISVGENAVFVDTGSKVDGAVMREELLDEQGELHVKEGDELDLYVVAVSPSEIKLSRAMSGEGGLEVLREAYETRTPVEGKVRASRKGGFDVEVMKKRAFCPVSQIDDTFVEDPTVYVGETYQFAIIKFEEGGRNVVVSRRELLMREKAEAAAKFMENAKVGDVVEAAVVRLAPFGAFMEIAPGLEGLCHVSELSWSRVNTPEELVKIGDRMPVKLLSIKEGDKGRLRVSLSAKQAQADPWDGAGERFKPGEKLTGTVVRLADFGAFVEVAPGIEGLVHVSEMSYAKRVNRPEEIVAPGQTVAVVVKDLDAIKRRLSLSMKDAEGDPWLEVAGRFNVGDKVTGVVEKKEQFGWFVTLMPGVTGLLPKSRMSRFRDVAEVQKLNVGDEIAVAVEEIRAGERKITLGPSDPKEAEDWKAYAPKPAARPQAATGGAAAASTGGGMGTLGDKLMQAMREKNKG